MRRTCYGALTGLVLLLVTLCGCRAAGVDMTGPAAVAEEPGRVVELPDPLHDSDVSVEEALLHRRSVRSYSVEALSLDELSQLLWAAQGVTDPRGFRSAPSAGALYPLELYALAGEVEDLAPGLYRYEPRRHQLLHTLDGDLRSGLAEAALWQEPVAQGAVVMVFTAVYERTTQKYDERGIRYVHIELGHAAQNLCLQATALDLGAVTIGAFFDDEVTALLDLPEDERPLYLIPVGRQK